MPAFKILRFLHILDLQVRQGSYFLQCDCQKPNGFCVVHPLQLRSLSRIRNLDRGPLLVCIFWLRKISKRLNVFKFVIKKHFFGFQRLLWVTFARARRQTCKPSQSLDILPRPRSCSKRAIAFIWRHSGAPTTPWVFRNVCDLGLGCCANPEPTKAYCFLIYFQTKL